MHRLKTEMEMYFDMLQEAYNRNPNSIATDSSLQTMLQNLIAYYDGPDWRSDYESDEHGELPQGLKRGVLSEDGVYNFLTNFR